MVWKQTRVKTSTERKFTRRALAHALLRVKTNTAPIPRENHMLLKGGGGGGVSIMRSLFLLFFPPFPSLSPTTHAWVHLSLQGFVLFCFLVQSSKGFSGSSQTWVSLKELFEVCMEGWSEIYVMGRKSEDTAPAESKHLPIYVNTVN